MKLMRVTAVDYSTVGDEPAEAEPVVKVAGRTEDRERVVKYVYGTRPYMYAPEGTAVTAGEEFRVIDSESGYESYDGIPLEKWTCRVPDDVGVFQDQIEGDHESDIPYYRRASIDYNLSGHIRVPDEKEVDISDIETDVNVSPNEEIEPRVVIGDIEVETGDVSFEKMVENASQPVTNVTFWDSETERYDTYVVDPEEELEPGEVTDSIIEAGFTNEAAEGGKMGISIHRSDTEEALMDNVLRYFEDTRPDITTGWNWVNFDILYLLRRFKRLHDPSENDLDINRLTDAGRAKKDFSDYHGSLARAITCVPAIDMMDLFTDKMSFSNWRSSSLDYVSEEELGRSKIQNAVTESEFAAYNIVDVELCVKMEKKHGIVEFFQQVAELSQVQIYDVFSEMRLVDGFLMSQSDDDEILPPQPDDAEVPPNAGGLVLQPSSGIQEWVGVMDLKSLYPSCMITWNISPETTDWLDNMDDPDLKVPWVPPPSEYGEDGFRDYPVEREEIEWDQLGVDMSEEGLIPKYVKLLFEKRKELKERRNEYEPGTPEYETWDMKQAAVKVIMNSFYGVMSNDYWRLAKHGLGDAVTSAARYTLFLGKETAEETGYPVRYGDTDSLMVSFKRDDEPATEEEYKQKCVLDMKGLTNQINNRMEKAIRDSGLEGDHPYLHGTLPHGKDAHCLHYEAEKLYRRYIQFGKKKRYAGLMKWKEGKDVDDVDVTGFESKRSDTPRMAAEVQREVLHKVLDGEGFEAVSEYVSGFCDAISDGSIELGQIARPKSISKKREDYTSNTQTLRACRASEELLEGYEWAQGDDPFLVYINGTPPMKPEYDVMALEWGDELPEGFSIDSKEHIRIGLKAPLSPILDELDWEWKAVKNGKQAGSAMESDWGGESESSVETDDESESDESGQSGALNADW